MSDRKLSRQLPLSGAETARRPSLLLRTALALSAAVIAALATWDLLSWVGRWSQDSAFLLRDGVVFPACLCCGAAIAVGVFAFARRGLGWWLLGALVAIPVMAVSALVLPLRYHIAMGTPHLSCELPGLETEQCIGRDWSFLQDRRRYWRATGRMDSAICRARLGAASGTGSPRTPDGWIRCPYDDGSLWRAAACDDLGLADYDRCLVCSGQSDTVDSYIWVQAFSADCARAAFVHGVNVAPASVDACARGTERSNCSSGAVYDDR